MIRHEAFIQKEWQQAGLAQILISRHHDDGLVDFAFYLVDFLCLGLKDTFHENKVPVSVFDEFLKEHIPEDYQERIHPACAKKLIEGAITYAEKFGFSPSRDFRKTRKILSSINVSVCPIEFTYGRDGRPCYVESTLDSPERVEKVLAMLEARCGVDGFTHESLEDNIQDLRKELLDFLEVQPDSVPRFYHVSGFITAMLLCPTTLSPVEVLEFLKLHGLQLEDEDEAQYLADLLKDYWNYLNDLILETIAPGAPEVTHLVDIDTNDFQGDDAQLMLTIVFVAWCQGFHAAVNRWPELWKEVLERPDLKKQYDVIQVWAEIEKPGNIEKITAADDQESLAFGHAVIALARALRKP